MDSALARARDPRFVAAGEYFGVFASTGGSRCAARNRALPATVAATTETAA